MGPAAHDGGPERPDTACVGVAQDPVFDAIAALLAAPASSDEPSRLEVTLTDGYARALALEAEQGRLERQLAARAREAAGLEDELDRRHADLLLLREQLRRLQRRHSAAVRAATR
jgi:hypothetical protein